MQLQAHDNAGHHYPLKILASSEAIRVKPSNLERTDEHPQEGKIVNGRCMRYGEWFNLQDLLDTSMNRDSTAGDALGTPSPPSMPGSKQMSSQAGLLLVCCWCSTRARPPSGLPTARVARLRQR